MKIRISYKNIEYLIFGCSKKKCEIYFCNFFFRLHLLFFSFLLKSTVEGGDKITISDASDFQILRKRNIDKVFIEKRSLVETPPTSAGAAAIVYQTIGVILPYLLILILVRYDDKPSDKVDSSYYIDSFNRKVTFIAYNSAFLFSPKTFGKKFGKNG